MENNVNLNELWGKQNIDPPQIEILVSKFSKIKRKNFVKVIALNIIMLLTITIFILIWKFFEPRLITTKIGIVIMLLTIVAYLLLYNRLIPLLRRVDENQSSKEFLEAVIKLKEEQKLLQTRMLQLYFIVLTVGLCLSLYEYVSLMPFTWSILAYSVTLGWIGFNWFYLRPLVIRKEQNKLNEIIGTFERIKAQN